ncbi:MAG: cytochrome c maturation protein CcmE [Actinobacteria bacterium]|nr:cytochrome c maturation protein CcmE [Actinomycetota bacterium]NDG76943.1 cytochrome c maturation protein CcmE [Acidimicrobiia bacterium]
MELTPRPDQPASSRRRLLPVIIAGLAVVVGIGIVAIFLTSSIDYYCNVDEIGVREGCDDTRRVRVQGTVDEGSLEQRMSTTAFVMSFNGVSLPVEYDGEPGGIFQECIPVVAHGRVVDGVLQATRIEVKHSNEYEAQNKERITEAETSACS